MNDKVTKVLHRLGDFFSMLAATMLIAHPGYVPFLAGLGGLFSAAGTGKEIHAKATE